MACPKKNIKNIDFKPEKKQEIWTELIIFSMICSLWIQWRAHRELFGLVFLLLLKTLLETTKQPITWSLSKTCLKRF